MTTARPVLVRWLFAGRAGDPVQRAIEPLVRVAMVIGVASSLLGVALGWLGTADSEAYRRYAIIATPIQLVGLLVSLWILERAGPRAAARVFAIFVLMTLAATSLRLGAVVVAASIVRLLVPTLVVTMALEAAESFAWVLGFLGAAWIGALVPSFAGLAPVVRLETVGRFAIASVVLLTCYVILIVFRRALRTALAEGAASARDLARSQRLESLGRLGAGTAHDFNGLLTTLRLLLEEVATAQTPAERATALGAAEQAIRQAQDLTRRLLQLARGNIEQAMEAFDLREAVDEAIAAVRPTYGFRVTIERDFAATPVSVRGSRVELRQIATNLLMNAGDAISGTGRVYVRVAHDDEDRAVLEVHDSGAGIPPDVRATLFEPFVTTKPAGRGSGLGLSTSQAIAHRHGGRLESIDSADGGATFVLTLPAAPTGP